MPELESHLAQLQDELKKAKDQLNSSDSSKKKAHHEAEDAKKQLTAMLAKLEETQNQLKELSDSEEARVQELCMISQDRDKAWQSEVEAVQKHHSFDSSALASALNEIQRFKVQLERVSESEASQARHAESAHAEIRSLRIELTETLELVEKLKNRLNDSRESEAEAVGEVGRAQMLLEVLKNTEETLHSEHGDAVESCKSLLAELEQSKNRVNSLEELVGCLQADLDNVGKKCDESDMFKTDLNSLKHEASRLRVALEAAEQRYQDQYLQSTHQIRDAYELVKLAKSESQHKEAHLGAKLQESRAEIEGLEKKLIGKENALHSISLNRNMQEIQLAGRETELAVELKKSESVLEALEASLLDKETRFQAIMEENEMLKSEFTKRETERSKASEEALSSARAAEKAALTKLGYLTEEEDRSCRKAARFSDELNAAQASSSELEAELRKLKVQSDQWRKAAEAAAAMLSTGNNGKHVERTGSFDYHTIGGKLHAPYSEDTDYEESPKKKHGSMLKKIGVLLKKGQL